MERNEEHTPRVVVDPLPVVDAEDVRILSMLRIWVVHDEDTKGNGNDRQGAEDQVSSEEYFVLLLYQLFIVA